MISVICPVYKAEAYIRRCLDSVITQTYKDWELILVDDGSPDMSGRICDAYAEKDSRIKVIHKENGGVSHARQTGIETAQGEYTIHVDPDDWMEPEMLEELYDKAKATDADMVICDFIKEDGNESIYRKQEPSQLDHETVFRELFTHIHGSCWNKLIKRQCYAKYNIRFPEGYCVLEDLYVMILLLTHDIKIAHLPKALYHYDVSINENSMVHKYSEKTVFSVNGFYDTFHHLLEGKGLAFQAFKYGYLAKSIAEELGIYTRKEIRHIASDINHELFIRGINNILSEPEYMILWLTMYVPEFIVIIYYTVIFQIRKLRKQA